MLNYQFGYSIGCMLLFVFSLNAQILDDAYLDHLKFKGQDFDRCCVDDVHGRLITQHPHLKEEIRYFKEEGIKQLSSLNNAARNATSTIVIPTVFHVVHNGEPIGSGANISDALILNALDILNTDLTFSNVDITDIPSQWQSISGNPNIEFCFASVDENGEATNGITRTELAVTGPNANNNNIDSEIKDSVGWDANQYMNVYIVGIPGTTNN
ncbi:MAG: hypothetical protein AAGK97_10945, partial [Bacteroidota bacterium]